MEQAEKIIDRLATSELYRMTPRRTFAKAVMNAKNVAAAVSRGDIPVIVADNVLETVVTADKSGTSLTDDFVNVVPPFPFFWIEGKAVPPGDTRAMKLAMYVHAADRDQYRADGYAMETADRIRGGFDQNPSARWMLLIIPIYEYEPGIIFHGSEVFIPVNEKGRVLSPPCTAVDVKELTDQRDKDALQWIGNERNGWIQPEAVPADVNDSPELHRIQQLSFWYSYFLLSTLAFINCRNVELVDIAAPHKLNKKRLQRGKPPIIRYRVIAIDTVAKMLRESGADPRRIGIGKALGMRRGHIKHYEKGRGLFGRWKGSYFWAGVAKGDESRGVVVKDYATNSESARRMRMNPPTRQVIEQRAADMISARNGTDAMETDQQGEAASRDAATGGHNTVSPEGDNWSDPTGIHQC